jgi:uncharacterized protein (DUF1501 family)
MNDLDRRQILKGGLLLGAGLGLGPQFLLRPAGAQSGAQRVLVVIFQRGAVDALNMVPPHQESMYYERRPGIAIPAPGSSGGGLDLDGQFALHPALSSLFPAFQAGELAVVHACGSHDPSRSHFDAQDFMETGRPGYKGAVDGWLNRHLRTATETESLFRGVALASALPRTLAGPAEALAVDSLSQLSLGTGEIGRIVRQAVEEMYGDRDDLPGAVVRDALDAIDIAGGLDPANYVPRNGAVYPDTKIGSEMAQIAQMIRGGVGLEAAFAEMGGWDTHTLEGGSDGVLANLLRELGDALGAFRIDMGGDLENVCVATMSEFGRTAAENGSGGTDHGHATAMFALGGTVAGGRVYGGWPGLEEDALYEGRDLAVTTDFRTFLAEIVERHLGNDNISEVFPDFDYDPGKRLGVIA